jgi:hypothetical protein
MRPEVVIIVVALAAAIGAAAIVFARRRNARNAEREPEPGAESPVRAEREAAAEAEPAAESETEPAPEVDALPEVLIDPRVRIEKAARTLEVISEERVVKRYRIGLGTTPIGPKERAEDGKTPEGSYYLCAKSPIGAHGPELTLSYPNEQDADRGLAERLITAREHRAIVTAQHRMQPPPRLTKLGGGVVITGSGTATDWTDGSIALDDCYAAEVFSALPLGTPVEIVP